MTELVVDSSVVVKWLVPELGTSEAVALRGRYSFVAPELLILECANVFWKKARRGEFSADEASLFTRAVEKADIEYVSIRVHAENITQLALELDHPVYDCAYLALAQARQCQFATADRRFVKTLQERRQHNLDQVVVLFNEMEI